MLLPVKTLPLVPVLEDLHIAANRVRTVGDPPSASQGERHALVGVAPGLSADSAKAEILAFAQRECSSEGALLVFLTGEHTQAQLALWRNALWPFAHVVSIYRVSNSQIFRDTLMGSELVRGGSGLRGALLVARQRAFVFAPAATIEKFDKNAGGWNGEPGKPGYAHFRWMRRHVARFAPSRASARRILDFGCGAGWVGIEAALAAPAAQLCAFDPSPQMMVLAGENARASGVARFEGRTGFGEAPPFPAAGEAAFDLVFSSGVISFAADRERWIDGLVGTLDKNATLVIGDINRDARGMRARRLRKALLPLRELNATTRDEVRAALERRGLRFEAWAGYQLSSPVPELMHFDQKRLGGALERPLLWMNQLASAVAASNPARFDSWVLRMRRA